MSTNLNVNRLNQTYLPADVTAMKANANATIGKIPAGATLTEAERANAALDINVVNKVFVEDVIIEMNSNGANILPTWVNMANITNDFTFFEQTDEVLTLFKNVVLRLSDSQRIAGREAYAAALKVYDLYKSAAEAGVPGAQESYDKLKVRFDRLGNSGSPVQPNP